MSVIKDDKTLMVRCKCHGHILEVTYDEDWYENAALNVFYFSVWNQTPTPVSFFDRLKLIWRLVKGKNLEGDDVLIDKEDARALINFLNKKLGETKNGK
jgi:hypothetical protein